MKPASCPVLKYKIESAGSRLVARNAAGEEVGALDFKRWHARPADTWELAALRVRRSLQGCGIGSELLKRWKRYVRQTLPLVYTQPTSKGSLRAIMRVFGRPIYLTDGIAMIKPETALGPGPQGYHRSRLPERYDFKTEYETVEAAGYDAIFCLQRRAPACNQWRDLTEKAE